MLAAGVRLASQARPVSARPAIMWAVVHHGAIRVQQVSTLLAIAEPAVVHLEVIVAPLAVG
jgi:hypothetical protein